MRCAAAGGKGCHRAGRGGGAAAPSLAVPATSQLTNSHLTAVAGGMGMCPLLARISSGCRNNKMLTILHEHVRLAHPVMTMLPPVGHAGGTLGQLARIDHTELCMVRGCYYSY